MSEQKSGCFGPLTGIKVVDLSRYAAGPACTRMLADMGAEVIKVEEPGRGDPGRTSPPAKGDMGGYFPVQNRNKKAVTLNLVNDKGKEILRRLVMWGDVLVENYRPGYMKRIGFDFPSVQKINARMIMVSLSGFGQTGPYAQRSGFDRVGQAMGGAMRSWGAGGPPEDISIGADPLTGVFGAFGVTLALYNRSVTGCGQHIDVDLMETIAYFTSAGMVGHVRGYDVESKEAVREPKGTFKTKDGRYMVIYAQDDRYWPRMAKIMGRADLADAPGYKSRPERNKHADELYHLMESWAAAHTSDEIEAAISVQEIPYARVQGVPDLIKDQHLRARNMIREVDHYGEILPMFAPYPILSGTPGTIRSPAPHVGQHNEEVYCGLLGFSRNELAEFKANGVI